MSFSCSIISMQLLVVCLMSALIKSESDCKSNPYFQYKDDIRVHEMTISQMANLTDHSLEFEQFDRIQSSLYYVKGVKEGQEIIICLPPKSGSTRLKMILNKMMDPTYHGQLQINYQKYYRFNPVENMEPSEISRILNDKKIPRFALSRNPYIRVISMFLDKIMRDTKKSRMYMRNVGFKLGEEKSFDRFVEVLHNRPRDPTMKEELLNQHFVSQSRICNMHLGMSYNVKLQAEQINEWYDCFIDLINMREELMHGWPSENKCYFSTPKTPCNGPYFEDGVLKQTSHRTTHHNTGSVNQVQVFFKNRTLVDMVTQMYLDDFINFNYSRL
eukprot:TRINITY_DN877_c0_g1_i5.p1 TRINITY_DN877_c0_g1~~TRINITY_DN877_c0_g1_i5.p1  ORF type:complete len:329 (-),score=9.80 TRINITY_DN877_c0_g1_i5:487-1473(-)